MFIGLSLKILKVAEWVDLIAGVEPFLVVEFSWNIHDVFREFHCIYIYDSYGNLSVGCGTSPGVNYRTL
jgi:hypothetical protein